MNKVLTEMLHNREGSMQCKGEIQFKRCKDILNNNFNRFFVGNGCMLEIDPGTSMYDCVIYAEDNAVIEIGANCNLNGLIIEAQDAGSAVRINNNTDVRGEVWGYTNILAREGRSVAIGRDCLLSGDITIRTGDGHSIINKNGERLNKSEDISIGNHVWIGKGAVILKGVSIGDNCIAGINAFLPSGHTYGENCKIVGNPAKCIPMEDGDTWIRERV